MTNEQDQVGPQQDPQQQQQQQPEGQHQNQQTAAAPAPAPSAKKQKAPINYELVAKYSKYYSSVFPAEEICQWLQYGETASYLSNREFCLTLPGDIFCRFKTFTSAQTLRRALMSDKPEKVDVGAVYQVPAEKRHQTPLVPLERELVFDIDMSDYDNIRSCCKGKKICEHCWPWMASAAKVIQSMVRDCFGYQIMMPVFSGRRGLHIWVCDAAARKLQDDERNAIVQHMTVVSNGFKLNCIYQLTKGGLHPALRRLLGPNGHDGIISQAFRKIFLNESNNNCIFTNADSADVFRTAVDAIMRDFPAFDPVSKAIRENWHATKGDPGTVMNRANFLSLMNYHENKRALKLEMQQAIMFALLYPRLDEKVSTRKDHLLKLPLCVHPGSGLLCCPLEFETVDDFNPLVDSPNIDQLNQTGVIPEKWMKPLKDIIQATIDEKKKLAGQN